MKFIKQSEFLYKHGKTRYTKKGIIDEYKAGKQVTIINEEGYNITKEFLILSAFGSNVPVDYLVMKMSDDELEDIILSGGYSSWLLRRKLNETGKKH